MIRNRHFVTKDVRAKKFYQRKGSLVENDSFGMEGNLTVLGMDFKLNFLEIYVTFIPFFVFGYFRRRSYKNTKMLCSLCLHFARQDGQDGKKWKENHTTRVTNIAKTKRRKYGMNET